VTTSGDLGYALGTLTVTIPDGRLLTTKFAVIWQRDPDGRWRIAVDSSGPARPRPPNAAVPPQLRPAVAHLAVILVIARLTPKSF
jgi:hypothetical protein